MDILPALGWSPWRLFIVEVIDEDVEADMPSCGVARGFAQVIERVQEREHAALAVGLQLEPQRLVVPSPEL